MKIVAFGASTSSTSINKTLAAYAANLIPNADVEVLDLKEFDAPLFSEDKEKEIGKSEDAQRFLAKLGRADAIVISFAEHNASYTAATRAYLIGQPVSTATCSSTSLLSILLLHLAQVARRTC